MWGTMAEPLVAESRPANGGEKSGERVGPIVKGRAQ